MAQSATKRWLDKAQMQILFERGGKTPAERLQWVFDFCARDISRLTNGDKENLRQEFALFLNTDPDSDLREFEPPDSGFSFEVPTDRQIWAVHVEISKVLRELSEKGMSTIPSGQRGRRGFFLNYRIVASGRYAELQALDVAKGKQTAEAAIERVRQVLESPIGFDGPPEIRALHWFARLAMQCMDAIQRCPEESCHRWFVRQRKNQDFCTARCKNRSATRAFRDRRKIEQNGHSKGRGRKKKNSKAT